MSTAPVESGASELTFSALGPVAFNQISSEQRHRNEDAFAPVSLQDVLALGGAIAAVAPIGIHRMRRGQERYAAPGSVRHAYREHCRESRLYRRGSFFHVDRVRNECDHRNRKRIGW